MAACPSGRARKAQIIQSNGDAAGVSERGANRSPRMVRTCYLEIDNVFHWYFGVKVIFFCICTFFISFITFSSGKIHYTSSGILCSQCLMYNTFSRCFHPVHSWYTFLSLGIELN